MKTQRELLTDRLMDAGLLHKNRRILPRAEYDDLETAGKLDESVVYIVYEDQQPEP